MLVDGIDCPIGAEEPAPFFLVGADRSGTTLLRLMVNAHSQLHVPRESWFLSVLLDALPLDRPLSSNEVDTAIEVIRTHERWRDWEIGDEELRARLNSLTEPLLTEVVDAVFRLSGERAGKYYWGDKTPAYVRDMDRLGALFPRAKFIHVVRDVRDVCLSLSKVWWHGHTFKEWARYWSEAVEAGIASGYRLGQERYLEVRYEDLVLHDERELVRVCRFLDVQFEIDMLKYHENAERHIAPWERRLHRKAMAPPKPGNIGKWRTDLSRLQLLSVEAVASGTMRKLGQERKFSGPAYLACVVWRAVIHIAGWSLPLRRRMGIHFPWLRGMI